MSFQLRCRHCSHWIGEAREPMEFVGVFKVPRERERIPEPRDTWRCKGCGFANVFRPVDAVEWREVETKG